MLHPNYTCQAGRLVMLQWYCECSGVTGGGAGGQSAPPETSDREIFADVSGKKGKGWKLRRKGGKLEMEAGKRQKKRWGPFFFFFFFFLLFTFENDENLFWVYQNGNFLPGKSISRREKNQEKWLCPLRKICLLRPCVSDVLTDHFIPYPTCSHWTMENLHTQSPRQYSSLNTVRHLKGFDSFDRIYHCWTWDKFNANSSVTDSLPV